MIALKNRIKINCDCFKLQPSAKLPVYKHRRAQILLVKFHIHTTLRQYIYQTRASKGPWRPFTRPHKDPESYISSPHSQRQTQHSAEGSSLNRFFSCSCNRSGSGGSGGGVGLSSTPSQHVRPAQCPPPAPPPVCRDSSTGTLALSQMPLITYTQTLSRNLLSYS